MDITAYIVSGIITLVFTLIGGAIHSKVNRTREELERNKDLYEELKREHGEKISLLQQTAVSENHVRKIVEEALKPLNSTLERLLDSVHKIEVHIAEEKGFKSAQALIERRRRGDEE
jgi:hypothetical protein